MSTKIDKKRNATYKEAKILLKKEGKCAIIRPTGFGKTGLLTRFIISKKYKNILYIYPSETVKSAVISFYSNMKEPITSEEEIPNVKFLTCMKLIRLSKKEILEMFPETDLIVVDECHVIGAFKTSKAIEKLIELFPEAHLLGATATPDRMDMIDPIARFFEDNLVSEYTLHDAFQDGILQKPYYVYCAFAKKEDDISETYKELHSGLKDCSNKENLIEDLNQRLIEISNLYDMDKVIRKTCDKYAKDLCGKSSTNYMKFLVFFSSFESIHKQGSKIKEWFEKAYPGHTIKVTIVTTEEKKYRDNVKKLNQFVSSDKTIDLIFSCDMMNLGYHVDDLTGIVMYRGTKSGTIYIQQLGRVLSTGTLNAGIVLDVVDNLHQKSMYKVLDNQSIYTRNAKKHKKELEKKKEKWEKFQKYLKTKDTSELTKKEISDFKKWENSEEEFAINEWNKHDESELKGYIRRFEKPEQFFRSSTLTQEDLIAVDYTAEYEELIRKVVAEPISMRCRQAYANYLEAGGKNTDENGKPFTSRKQFLEQLPPENIPIEPYCWAKDVSIDRVMEELGL